MDLTAVSKQSLDAAHVVHHIAIANRASPAAVIPGHTAYGGTIRCGDINRIEQSIRLEETIEMIQHHAWLDTCGTSLRIEGQ